MLDLKTSLNLMRNWWINYSLLVNYLPYQPQILICI